MQLMSDPEFSTNDLAVLRTELAFHRNRLAADRTLMAIMRTSLSLISFGFTIFSVFRAMADSDRFGHAVPDTAPGRFGLALVIFGVALLLAGIAADLRYMNGLRRGHDRLLASPVLAGIEPMPRSLITIAAIVLLLIGLVAMGLIMVRM
jgi:putative membrane protein